MVYVGIKSAELGLGKSAIRGAILGLTSSSIVCAASVIGRYFSKAILGINAPSTEVLAVMMAAIIIQNTIIGGIVTAAATFLARKTKKKTTH